MHWLDRLLLPFAPQWVAKRIAWRTRSVLLARHYEAASTGYRTQGWTRSGTDPNGAVGSAGTRLRESARDLVRNNAYAEAALSTIVDHAVGTGIVAKPYETTLTSKLARTRAMDRWKAWAETTACDADGRLDFAGIQKLVMRTVVESGEVLIRRRIRLPEDGLPIPLQLQVLEPDHLDQLKDGESFSANGVVVRRIIQGVEFDALGRRAAYWLLQEHPGSSFTGGGALMGTSRRIPAEEILHVFRPGRPGQVRGVSWFAPVMLRLKELDEFQDATLMKQKIAACLAVLTSDPEGTALGETDASKPTLDLLSPGMIASVAPGRTITVVDPPAVNEHAAYVDSELRAIAVGLGVTFEDLTGSYQNMPFSAARMSRLRHWARVDDWRWRMLIPQFCDPVWRWAMQAGQIMGVADVELGAEWTCPPPPMIDPSAEGLAYQRNIRSGIMTLSEAIRERGYDPDALLDEMASDWKKIDRLGLVLDCDPRRMTQAGQAQSIAKPGAAVAEPIAAAANANGNNHH